MASVITRFSAPWTTLRVVTKRSAEISPTTASTAKATSWDVIAALCLPGLPLGLDHRGAAGLALSHTSVGPLGQLLGQDPLERRLVQGQLDPLPPRPGGGRLDGLLAGRGHVRRGLLGGGPGGSGRGGGSGRAGRDLRCR